MWEPRRLITLWASTACYRDSFTFLYISFNYLTVVLVSRLRSVERQKDWRIRNGLDESSACLIEVPSWNLPGVPKQSTRNLTTVGVPSKFHSRPLRTRSTCSVKSYIYIYIYRYVIWDLRPDFYYCQTVAGLLMWGALSEERTSLSFTIAAGPCQHSLGSRVPWNLWPYFTVSDSRLPFSSLPTIRRAMVEVFDPASIERWTIFASVGLLITPLHEPRRTHRFQQYLYCCMHIRCPGNVFTELLPRNGCKRYNIHWAPT
jgi:hypothetical protein